MPIKNFFLPSSLTPTRSSCYPFLYTARKRPLSDYTTSTSLNCTSLNQPLTLNPFPKPSSSMTLNCMFLIPVNWITHSSEPPHHSSRIMFIEDTNNMQHKVMCPALQMYPRDRLRRGPDGPVACAPACFANAQLDPDPVKHYPCSTPLF
jgi:hypothetical protein